MIMKKQTTELADFEFNDAAAMRPRSVWCCWDGSGPKERAESTQRPAEGTGQHTAKRQALLRDLPVKIVESFYIEKR